MANGSRLMKMESIAAATLAPVTFISSATNPLTLLDEANFNSSRKLFVPVDNGYQPNVISISPTKKIMEVVERLRRDNPSVDWNDTKETAVFMMGAIREMTRKKEMPGSGKYEFSDYFKDLKKDNVTEITPDRIFATRNTVCLEHSVALASALAYLGMKPGIILMDSERDGNLRGHVVVGISAGKETIFLDPTNGIHSNDLATIAKTADKSAEWKVYPAIPYKEAHSAYLNLKFEDKINADFGWLRVGIKTE